jgi:drug/metabolite transporter (DMT)-like permease
MTFVTDLMRFRIIGSRRHATSTLSVSGRVGTFPISNIAYPFVTFMLAVILLGEPVTWTLPIGGALIVAGITWIVLEQRRAAAESDVKVELVRGVAFALAAACAWATATVWLRGQQGDLDALGAASLRIPAASVAVWATIAMTRGRGDQPLRPTTPRSLIVVAMAGILGTGLGSILFIYSVGRSAPRRPPSSRHPHRSSRCRWASCSSPRSSRRARSSARPSRSRASGSCCYDLLH